MRATYLLAGLAVVLAACEKKPETPAADTTAMATPAPGAGATHDVNMVLEGADYKYVPASLTIKSGDVVRFHSLSGLVHNVQFYPDSIPAGAAAALAAGMPEQNALAGPMINEPDGLYSISFANAPVGEYKFFCTPHAMMNMKGTITVQ